MDQSWIECYFEVKLSKTWKVGKIQMRKQGRSVVLLISVFHCGYFHIGEKILKNEKKNG